jgi:hypothetical protein
MKFGLGALDILTKNYDIEALEECFNAWNSACGLERKTWRQGSIR